MYKKRNIFTVLIIICAMLLVQVLPAATALAASLTDTLDFITAVKLTNEDGTAFGSNTSKDSALKLEYDYAIPNTSDVNAGDTFTIHLPQEIMISSPGGFELTDDNTGDTIGNGTIATDGTLVITFTDYAESHSNIHGNFWFDLSFDKDKIGDKNPVTITFSVGASTPPYTIDIDFKQPVPATPTIQKSGSYNASTKEITWTLTVNKENTAVEDAQVKDTIPDGQTFVDGSVTLNGSAANPSNYTYDSETALFTYTFPTHIESQEVLTFKTKVSDSEFSSKLEGATVTEHNSAEFDYDGGPSLSNDATISTTVDFISKNGSYDSTDKLINWTITVDNNYVTIPNAVVSDTIPAKLALETNSVYLDNTTQLVLGTDYTYDSGTGAFSYAFPGSISEPHTIKFITDVDPAFYIKNQSNTLTNTAAITGTGVPGNAQASKGVGVTSTLIDKQGHSYDASTGQITWYVYADSNNIDIQNCTVTDEIPIGQQYVDNSATINNGADINGFTYTAADPGDSDKTGTLKYTFSGDISETYLITFKTQILDTNVYKNNVTKTYYNTAYIHGSNIPDSSKQGSRTITSQVIAKSGTGYDYETRVATWKITVDADKVPLLGVVITDDIKKGQEYVAGSAVIDNGADAAGFSYTAAAADDPDKSGTLTYTFSGSINDTYHITFKTHVADLTIFDTNGDKTLQNTAKISHFDITDPASATGSETVHNTVISKTGSYTAGNRYIDWTILINTNTIPLSDATITDTLQEGLMLDTTSLDLCRMTVNPDGSLTPGDEVSIDADNVHYDFSSRTLTFTIPAPVSGSYRLTLRTIITDKSKSPFTNTASFSGTGSKQTGTSQSVSVAWSGSGSTGTGENGSIQVYKVDSEDSTKTISGAVFDLYDRYGNKVQEATTGEDGSALFDFLRFDVNYTVKEASPPTGYLISSEAHTFQIHGSDESYNITYNYADVQIKGSITFSKYDTGMNPVPGTGFTLYDSKNNIAATAQSGSDGAVTFTDVPYGDYTIKETSPAEGFLGSDTVLYASVKNNGETVTLGDVHDDRIYGNITMLKTASDGTTALQGATFKLYKSTDTSFKSPVATSVSDASGIVLFQNIQYGNYVIRETAAPSGYAISSAKVSVTVTQDGTTVNAGTFTDKKKTHDHSPQTGDDIYFYIGIFVLSAICITAVIIAAVRSGRRQGSLR